ncbi:MAG: hypothetical protein ACC726_10885 [Chloroflexota bacterium]
MQAGRVSRAPVVVLIVFGVVATVLVFVGIQRSGEPPPEVEITRAGTAEEPRDVTVILRDFRFDPTPIVLVPGETVRFTILNGGTLEHDFVIGDDAVQRAWAVAAAAAKPPSLLERAPPASVPPDTGGLRVLLGSGDQAIVEYQVPGDQRLALLCQLPGHIEKGMVGAVELRDVVEGE